MKTTTSPARHANRWRRVALGVGKAVASLVAAAGVIGSAAARVPAVAVDAELRESPVRVVSIAPDAERALMLTWVDAAGVVQRVPGAEVVRLTFDPPSNPAPPASGPADAPPNPAPHARAFLPQLPLLRVEQQRLAAMGQLQAADRLTKLIAQLEAIEPASPHAADEESSPAPAADQPAPGPWRLELTDGQRWVGQPHVQSPNAETLCWTHPALGTIDIALDRITRIERIERLPTHLDQASRTATPASRPWNPSREHAANDAVTLLNGDRLTGFIARLDDAGLTLETDRGELPLRWDQLAGVTLANPKQPARHDDHTLALRDGSVVRVRSLTLQEDTLTVTPRLIAETLGLPDGSADDREAQRALPVADAHRLDPAYRGRQLLDLTDLSPAVEDATAFGLPYPPLVIDHAAHRSAWVHAPTTLSFSLPAPAQRLAGTATLLIPPNLPPDARALAEVSLRIADRRGTQANPTLTADRPTPFRVPLDGDTLDITVQPGPHGPTLGRVRLDHLRVLLQPHPSARP